MKRWSGWSRSIAGAAAVAALVLGGGAIAYADSFELTADTLEVNGSSPVDLGVLACGASDTVVVSMDIDRGGNSATAGHNVFASGSEVTFTKETASGVTATNPDPASVVLPSGWAGLPQNSSTDSSAATSTITVAAGNANGSFTGSVTYKAVGVPHDTSHGPTLTKTESVNVEWKVEDCGVVVDPVDVTPPVVVLTCPAAPIPQGEEAYAEWTASDEDGGSGLVTAVSGSILLDTSVLGEHLIAVAPEGTAVDDAGNRSVEVDCEYAVVDVTPPVVQLTCPVGAVILGSVAEATWTATDETGGSGLATAVSGSIALDTTSVGAKTAVAVAGTAVDNAGNPSIQVECPYSVVYDFDGFFRPVDMAGVVNSVKAGSAVPMKFSLDGDQGLDIIAAGYPRIMFTACATGAETDMIETTVTAGASSLSYDPVADQYVYVWKTDKSWAGKCGTFAMQLDDGLTRTAEFKFLK